MNPREAHDLCLARVDRLRTWRRELALELERNGNLLTAANRELAEASRALGLPADDRRRAVAMTDDDGGTCVGHGVPRLVT